MGNSDIKEKIPALEEDDFLRNVLDGISDSIKIIDQNFNLLYTNKAGCEGMGRPLSHAIEDGGKCFEEFYKDSQNCSWCVVGKVFESGAPAFNTFSTGEDGSFTVLEVSAFPLKGKSGKVEGVIEIVRNVTELKKDQTAGEEFSDIITQNEKMLKVFELIGAVARTNSTVLIFGETGTGKELIARAIHRASQRSEQKFIAMNCGSISDSLLETELFGHEKGAFTGAQQRRIGKFELAHNGTLFLDEIGDISPNMQVKILRALQESEVTRVGGNDTIKVNVRFVCATNVDLKTAVDKGVFREDLYYRLNVVPINLPSLRERIGDIDILAEHYLGRFNKLMGKNLRGFTTSAIAKMKLYDWPGNIRELRNLIERAVIFSNGSYVDYIDIPENGVSAGVGGDVGSMDMKDTVADAEREYLVNLLKKNSGNIKASAEAAGVNTRTIHRKMKDFGIKKEVFK